MEKMLVECPLCGFKFQMGPHAYEGKKLNLYDTFVCNTCWEGNWDGWNQESEKKLIKILNEKGKSIPKRNDKGLLPRD